MRKYLDHVRYNFKHRSEEAPRTAWLILGAMILIWIVFNAIFSAGIFGLIFAIGAVFVGGSYVPKLSWLWISSEAVDPPSPRNLDDKPEPEQTIATEAVFEELSAQKEDPQVTMEPPQKVASATGDLRFATTPRTTPKGARLLKDNTELAVMEVKAVAVFWGWFLPTIFAIGAFVPGIPLGGYLGAVAHDASGEWQGTLPAYIFNGSAMAFAAFLVVAIIFFNTTRPWLRFRVTPDVIKVNGRVFDRQYYGGMRIGYKSSEAQLKTGLIAPTMGVQLLRLSYGPWGEDLDYMVNAYHAEEIVNWMNEIIDSVGNTELPSYEPYAGRKIELL